LGIPDVIDRVVQEAVRQVLEPLWEPTFHCGVSEPLIERATFSHQA
jgi:hypothetical protein